MCQSKRYERSRGCGGHVYVKIRGRHRTLVDDEQQRDCGQEEDACTADGAGVLLEEGSLVVCVPHGVDDRNILPDAQLVRLGVRSVSSSSLRKFWKLVPFNDDRCGCAVGLGGECPPGMWPECEPPPPGQPEGCNLSTGSSFALAALHRTLPATLFAAAAVPS
eukprot:CAMPEP_0174734664 /NCGR_PEP_ID=MMETSP1094-20130205/63710_1 /TAXON_ID=156173 /ORGANISM="Chrysochromulina brevifilum, Strain UTEX LB 985" /LENGTH=162 /DNA_ID=CAMNT_0015937513 /DNA_START=158 /DNA_END=645 /DNA_ORIENTATION=+